MIELALHSMDAQYINEFKAAVASIKTLSVSVYDSDKSFPGGDADVIITDRLKLQSADIPNIHLSTGLTPKLVDQALSIGFDDVWSTDFMNASDIWSRLLLVTDRRSIMNELLEEQESSHNLIDAFRTGKIDRIPSDHAPSGVIRLVDEKLFEENQRLLRQIEKKNSLLEEMAHFDPLTGLPNRRMFTRHLKREMARSARHQHIMALFFIDLDHFKAVNDNLGHDAGDLLLKEASERQCASVREEDIVCRIAGDEFAVILTDIENPKAAGAIAQKIIDHLAMPFHINGTEVEISASIGIACHPYAGEDADALNKHADLAMYRAKEKGRNNYQFYTERFNETVVTSLKVDEGSEKVCIQKKPGSL